MAVLLFPYIRQLDVSFNILRKIEGLERLTRIKKLFLLHNKISSIANLNHFTSLEMLELGSNRIRVRWSAPFGGCSEYVVEWMFKGLVSLQCFERMCIFPFAMSHIVDKHSTSLPTSILNTKPSQSEELRRRRILWQRFPVTRYVLQLVREVFFWNHLFWRLLQIVKHFTNTALPETQKQQANHLFPIDNYYKIAFLVRCGNAAFVDH